MGLDFSHCEARWTYSGFNRFRIRLAREAGIHLDAMEGFQRESMRRDYDKEPIPWGKILDPIASLLNHSDCDGELTTLECRRIAPRLRELVSDWPEDDYDKKMALELADGMQFAASKKEALEFQ